MDLYRSTSYSLSEILTKRYSTSFSMSSRLFDLSIRHHIYAIYGMVRIADEIVDTYEGNDQASLLDNFESEVLDAVASGYSTNPIVFSFAETVRKFAIPTKLITAFFYSMRQDLTDVQYTQELYEKYIYGSAEVIGLMCLYIFSDGDQQVYAECEKGAIALGAAYQKINFLRDIKDDYERLGRVYFPGVAYETMSEEDKRSIEADIMNDLDVARRSVEKLPKTARRAVKMSLEYYEALFLKLCAASVDDLKSRRIRVPNVVKVLLLAKAGVR